MGIFNSPIFAQTGNGLSYADSLLLKGDKFRAQKEYTSSDSFYRLSKTIRREEGDWNNWFKCISRMQKNAKKLNEYDSWMDSLDVYLQIIPKSEVFISSKLINKKAKVLAELGDLQRAAKLYQEADLGFQSLYEDPAYKTDTLLRKYLRSNANGLSLAFIKLGDPLSAIQYCEKAIDIAKEIDDLKKYRQGLSLLGLYYYFHGDYKEAIKKCEFALSEGGDPSYLNVYLADIYLAMDSLDRAEEYLKINLLKEPTDDLHFSLSSLYEKKNDTKKAAREREKGIALLIADEGASNRTIVKEYVNTALMYNRFGNSKQVKDNLQKALQLRFPDNQFSSIYERPPIHEGVPDIWILEAYWLKARDFNESYLATKNSKDLEEAKYYYDLIFNALEELKLNFYSVDAKYQMGSYEQQIYTEAIDFYLSLHTSSRDERYIEKAMSLAQRANSFVLKNEITFLEGMQIVGVDINKVNQYKELAAKAANIESADGGDPIALFNTYNTELLDEYPTLVNFQQAATFSVDSILSRLDRESILVKYHYFEGDMYRFLLTDQSARADKIALDNIALKEIKELISLSSGNKDWNDKVYRKKAHSIYQLIIGDILSDAEYLDKSKLIIVPDGPLKNLSFNALVTNDIDRPLTADDYLISTHTISYLFYCSQLKANLQSSDKVGKFIGFGLEYDDAFLKEIIEDYKNNDGLEDDVNRSFSLKPLKFADEEALHAAKLLGGKSYVNDKANLQIVMDEIADFSMVHLSAHALLDMDDYLESAIIFRKDNEQNYKLKYKDILGLNLKTDLVVLSACQTGIGKNIDSEASASLSKAFIQSGCKSTVSSYWEVPDESTMKVMELFYKNIKSGMAKATAMQQAQLSYLRDSAISNPRQRTPLHWASWTVYGDTDPVQLESANWMYYGPWVVGVLAVFLLVYLYYKRSIPTHN